MLVTLRDERVNLIHLSHLPPLAYSSSPSALQSNHLYQTSPSGNAFSIVKAHHFHLLLNKTGRTKINK